MALAASAAAPGASELGAAPPVRPEPRAASHTHAGPAASSPRAGAPPGPQPEPLQAVEAVEAPPASRSHSSPSPLQGFEPATPRIDAPPAPLSAEPALAPQAGPAPVPGQAGHGSQPSRSGPVGQPVQPDQPDRGSPGSRAQADRADRRDELSPAISGASLTLDELCAASGLRPDQVASLESFGLIEKMVAAGVVYYDEEALTVAKLATEFGRYGIEPRHLRLYRNAADREAGLVEQVITPLLRQRNPEARQRAVDAAGVLARLGQGLRSSLVRRELRRQLKS